MAQQILLVEDNSDHAFLTKLYLEKHGVKERVLIMKDGLQALEYLTGEGEQKENHKEKPRLIILDIKLPKLDGIQLLKIIKSNEELKDIPVVIFTTSTKKEEEEKCFRYGADGFFTKGSPGLNFGLLLEGINRHLQAQADNRL